MSYTLDANLLLYASDESSPYHERSRELLREAALGPEIVYLFWPTIMAYLRIATHPAVFRLPLSMAEAIGNIDALIGRAHVRTPGEQESFWVDSSPLPRMRARPETPSRIPRSWR